MNLWDLVSSVSRVFDTMSTVLALHNLRVSCLALRLAEEMGLGADERMEVALAGALHDIGAFSLQERLDILAFEETHAVEHARAGFVLLKGFEPFEKAAMMVRFHHLKWAEGAGARHGTDEVPIGSHIIHLADRAVVLIEDRPEILRQVSRIRESIAARRGAVFCPEVCDAFERLALKDYVWLDVVSGSISDVLRRELAPRSLDLDADGLLELSRLFCYLIDFKSEFTAAHSSGVAAVGTALAGMVGFSPGECRMFEVAAYLHDLGKLAIPKEILEKPSRLDDEEWDVMRSHVYYTYQVLCPVEALGTITSWGALHQERLNGSGYPFRYGEGDLPLGARIMAVADIFTGITEDRPYRKGMSRNEAIRVLQDMAGRGEIDGRIMELAVTRFDEINTARKRSQTTALMRYEAFRTEIAEPGAEERLTRRNV